MEVYTKVAVLCWLQMDDRTDGCSSEVRCIEGEDVGVETGSMCGWLSDCICRGQK